MGWVAMSWKMGLDIVAKHGGRHDCSACGKYIHSILIHSLLGNFITHPNFSSASTADSQSSHVPLYLIVLLMALLMDGVRNHSMTPLLMPPRGATPGDEC